MMDSELNLNIDDYNKFLSYHGKINGCVITVNKEIFYENIIKLYKNDLKNANAVLIEFDIGKNASLFELNEMMTMIHDCCSPDTSLVFGTRTNSNTNIDSMICRILISVS